MSPPAESIATAESFTAMQEQVIQAQLTELRELRLDHASQTAELRQLRTVNAELELEKSMLLGRAARQASFRTEQQSAETAAWLGRGL